jgi:6-phosphofructokinase 1
MKDTLRGVAVVAHGGGPTQVINASLAGVIEECSRHPEITALYGARHGILGVIGESFINLTEQDPELVQTIGRTPGSAIGSCRRKLSPADYERILAVFRAHDVRYFFYTGGNDSMDTASQIARLARESGYELRVIGIPKTIDNDLAETDHSPGYGSAARFIAHALRDIGGDNWALPTPVTVVEVMGRNAGWLVAATSLARHEPDDAPHLIYLPERPVSEDQFVAHVEAVYRRLGRAVVAVCEGQTNEKGEPFGADLIQADGFQHRLAGNLAHVLAQLITRRLARPQREAGLARTVFGRLHLGDRPPRGLAVRAGGRARSHAGAHRPDDHSGARVQPSVSLEHGPRSPGSGGQCGTPVPARLDRPVRTRCAGAVPRIRRALGRRRRTPSETQRRPGLPPPAGLNLLGARRFLCARMGTCGTDAENHKNRRRVPRRRPLLPS